jgi:hypothetical protein
MGSVNTLVSLTEVFSLYTEFSAEKIYALKYT